jgi:hypothetical protein
VPRAPRNRSPRNRPLADSAAHEVAIVTDDWPAELPILDAELELLRAEALDILSALLDHDPG